MIKIMMARSRWVLSGLALMAVIAFASFFLSRRAGRAPATRPLAQAPVVSLSPQTIIQGTVEAQQVVTVATPISGTVQDILVNPGDMVYEGQLLAQIRNTGLESQRDEAVSVLERARSRVNSLDSALIAARLEASRARADATRARGEFEKAEKVYLRQQMLLNAGATPRLVFERAEKDYQLAKGEYESLEEVARQAEDKVASVGRQLDEARRNVAEKADELEQARESLSAGEVRAPVDGLILSRRAEAGQEVTTDVKDLFVIAVNLVALQVVLEPEPSVLARIRSGQQAVIRLAEVPDQGIPAKVREVKDGKVFVEFTSPGPEIRPGLVAQVVIELT